MSKMTQETSPPRQKPRAHAAVATEGAVPAAGVPLSDGERLLQAAAGFAALVDPAAVPLRQIHGLLQQSLPAFELEYPSVEAFSCALHLALAEGRLDYVTRKAGMLPPGVERIRCALTAYLDFSLAHAAVAQFCVKARVHFRSAAEQSRQRNALVAMMISVEISSMRCRHAQESGRMLQAVLADVAGIEVFDGAVNEKLRSNLMACVRALTVVRA